MGALWVSFLKRILKEYIMTRDRVTGLIGVILGIAVAIMTSQLPPTTMSGDIGPKAFPYIAAGILILCGSGLLITGRKQSPVYYTKHQFMRLCLIFAVMLGFVVAMQYLGYVIASFAALLILCSMFSQGKNVAVWKRIVFSVLMTAALYVMFVKLFSIPLPSGVLF